MTASTQNNTTQQANQKPADACATKDKAAGPAQPTNNSTPAKTMSPADKK